MVSAFVFKTLLEEKKKDCRTGLDRLEDDMTCFNKTLLLQWSDHVLSMTAKEINHVNANNQEPG